MKFYILLLLILLFDVHLAKHTKHGHKKHYLRHRANSKLRESQFADPDQEDDDLVLYDTVPGQNGDDPVFQEVDYVNELSPEVLQDVRNINDPTGVIEVGKEAYKIGDRTFITPSIYTNVELTSIPTKRVEGLKESEKATLWSVKDTHDFTSGDTTYEDVQISGDSNVVSRDNPLLSEDRGQEEDEKQNDLDPTIAFAPVEIRETKGSPVSKEEVVQPEVSGVDSSSGLEDIVLISPQKVPDTSASSSSASSTEDLGITGDLMDKLSQVATASLAASSNSSSASSTSASPTVSNPAETTSKTQQTDNEAILSETSGEMKDLESGMSDSSSEDLEEIQAQLLKDLEENLKAIEA